MESRLFLLFSLARLAVQCNYTSVCLSSLHLLVHQFIYLLFAILSLSYGLASLASQYSLHFSLIYSPLFGERLASNSVPTIGLKGNLPALPLQPNPHRSDEHRRISTNGRENLFKVDFQQISHLIHLFRTLVVELNSSRVYRLACSSFRTREK